MTAKRRTTYCPSWEDEFKYLRKAPNDKYQAFCVACNKTFLIDGSGKSQVRSHMSSPTHLDKEKQLKNQATFSKSTDDGVFIVKKQNFALSSDEQIMKVEILQELKTAGSNFLLLLPMEMVIGFAKCFGIQTLPKGSAKMKQR